MLFSSVSITHGFRVGQRWRWHLKLQRFLVTSSKQRTSTKKTNKTGEARKFPMQSDSILRYSLVPPTGNLSFSFIFFLSNAICTAPGYIGVYKSHVSHKALSYHYPYNFIISVPTLKHLKLIEHPRFSCEVYFLNVIEVLLIKPKHTKSALPKAAWFIKVEMFFYE